MPPDCVCAVIAPEVRIPTWALVYVPLSITISTVFFTRGGWKHTVAYVLYENAMCVVKLNAMLSGLFELSNAHEWVRARLSRSPSPQHGHSPLVRQVVTTKLGNWAVNKAKNSLAKVGNAVAAVVPAAVPLQKRKIYKTELLMSALFAIAAFFAIFINGNWQYAVFLVLQGITFFAFGLSLGVDGHRRTCC